MSTEPVSGRTSELISAEVEIERLRVRLFCTRQVGGTNHNTACSIWGDDGQGGTREGYPQPLPCNCGASANFARLRFESGDYVDGYMWNAPDVVGYRFVMLKHLAPPGVPKVRVLTNRKVEEPVNATCACVCHFGPSRCGPLACCPASGQRYQRLVPAPPPEVPEVP